MHRVGGGGEATCRCRTAVRCLPSQVSQGEPGRFQQKCPFCGAPALFCRAGSMNGLRGWRLWSAIFPLPLPAGSPCPLAQTAAGVALPCRSCVLKEHYPDYLGGGLMAADG